MRQVLFGNMVATVALAATMAAHAADSLEDGVVELAQEIVRKSAAADGLSLAVAAFPHADDSCSELSNYLVDELVLNLFNVGDGRLRIIERSQLERIFAELELSLSGAIDANTTKELGRIYGVDALLIGSITVLGDRLRVISRMIETETGQVFSAAATNIPKTATIVSLMDRPAAGGCTMDTRSAASSPTEPSAAVAQSPSSPLPRGAPDGLNQDIWKDFPQQNLAGLRATVTSAGVSQPDNNYFYATVSLLVQNESERDIRLLLIGPPPVIIDNAGNTYELTGFAGASQCGTLSVGQMSNCMSFEGATYSVSPNMYTQAPSGGQLTLSYSFRTRKNTQPGAIVTLSSNFAYLIIERDDKGEQKFTLRSVNLGIPNIPLNRSD